MPSLRLIVLRSPKLDLLKAFYETLGVAFKEEKHGKGPKHYSALLKEVVLELYPAELGESSSMRLGLAVAHLDKIVQSLRASGFTITQIPRKSEWGYQAVALDPDGRSVELTQE